MTLVSRALEALFDMLPGRARVIDAGGVVVQSNHRAITADDVVRQKEVSGGFSVRDGHTLTLRALWERERPALEGASSPLPFVGLPAMRALAGIEVHDQMLQVHRDGRVVSVSVTAIPIRDDEGATLGVLLVEEDAAARRTVESPKARIGEDRYMATSAKLAAGIMHEVNNVLSPILGAAFLLQRNAESPELVRDYSERIRAAAESGAALSERVARFVRQEPLHAGGGQSVDLSALVNEVLDDASGDLAQTLDVGQEGDRAGGLHSLHVTREIETGVHVLGLTADLRIAVRNVVQNAMEAMPNGGTLAVGVQSNGDDAIVILSDSGAGMHERVRQRAFEPFFSSKGSARAGMGLAETYGVVHRHRGTALIHSTPGIGTTVTLRFPLAKAPIATRDPSYEETLAGVEPITVPAAKQPRTENPSDNASGACGPLHVLVVEDDDAGRELLLRILRKEGYAVESAASCEEARERLAVASESPYHVMLTDVSLPDGSGWELAAYALAHVPALRIGVITGWDEQSRKLEAGGVEFVMRKPLRAAELLALIAGGRTSSTIG